MVFELNFSIVLHKLLESGHWTIPFDSPHVCVTDTFAENWHLTVQLNSVQFGSLWFTLANFDFDGHSALQFKTAFTCASSVIIMLSHF